MQGIATLAEEQKTSGPSSDALSFGTNAGAPESVRMPPQVGACIAESTDIMDIGTSPYNIRIGRHI
jgi:hypothetical protein